MVENIDLPRHVCCPTCSAFKRYLQLYQAGVRQDDGDPAI